MGNLLDFSLQNQKSIVSEIYSLRSQPVFDFRLRALPPVDEVLGNRGGVDGSPDPEQRIRHIFEYSLLILLHFFEVHFDCGFGVAGGGAGVVDELVELVEAHPAGVEAEDEQHALDEVGLPGAVGTHNTGEVAVEGADDLPARVGFEVLQDEVVDDEPRPSLPAHPEDRPHHCFFPFRSQPHQLITQLAARGVFLVHAKVIN